MQIIVLGMHRAGTSAVTRLINMMGAYLGPEDQLLPATPDNPKGYWEHVEVQQLNEFILKKLDANWRLVSKVDLNKIDQNILYDFNKKASKIILEMDNHTPWVIKDPRLCLLFPLWLPLLKAPICIHVSRHPIAVAQSLEKRDGIPLHFGITLWEHYNTCAIMASNGLPRFNVSYDQLMEEPDKIIDKIYKALINRGVHSLRLPCKKDISKFLKNELQHYKILDSNFTNILNIGQIKIWKILRDSELKSNYEFDNSDLRILLLKDYEQIFSNLGILRTEIHQLNIKLNQLNIKLNQLEKKYLSDINTMVRFFEGLHHDTQLIFDSLTWKFGYLFAEVGRKIGLLQRVPMVQEHVKKLIKSYQRWRKNNSLALGLKNFHENFITSSSTIENTDKDFDEEDYLNRYPDVRDAVERGEFRSGYEHYQLIGRGEIDQGKRHRMTFINLKNSSSEIHSEANRKWYEKEIQKLAKQPIISVIMPVYNVEACWLEAAIQSVQYQIYPHWELCIADDHSTHPEIINYLKSLNHPMIKTKFLDKNYGIAGASNAALSLATGEYIAFLDHDDEITPDAFYEVVKIINEHNPDLIYSDEDKLTREGYYLEPHFKPDYSPDLILSINYICHLSVYRKNLLEKIGYFRTGFDGAQDYDLLLRVLDHTDRVFHIQKILYHWRKIPGSTAAKFDNKHYAWQAGRLAVKDTLKRRNIAGKVILGDLPGNYRVKRQLQKKPKISIIVPFQDKPDLLQQCIDSILIKSTYHNFELVGISNNSLEPETHSLMKYYQNHDSRIRFLTHNIPFNFSTINNYAAAQANGEHLLLLNNDIVVITPDWLEALLEHSQRPEIGAVGAKLYYPDDTVQHGGVIIGIGGIAGHAHKYYQRGDTGYFHRLNLTQNLSAVTAACLMVKKSLYSLVGGMDEQHLAIAFNDVDFCLRLREHGYLNVFTPYCELYHHESKTRGYEDTPQKKQRFANEIAYMRKRHANILQNGDPYYNPNLPLDREDFGML